MSPGLCTLYVGKWWHQDALPQEDNLVDSVQWSGQCSSGKPSVQDINLTCDTYPSIVADQVHLFKAVVFLAAVAFFSRIIQLRNALRNRINSWWCLASKFPKTLFNQASFGCALTRSQTWSRTEKGPSDNVLLPETTGHLQSPSLSQCC